MLIYFLDFSSISFQTVHLRGDGGNSFQSFIEFSSKFSLDTFEKYFVLLYSYGPSFKIHENFGASPNGLDFGIFRAQCIMLLLRIEL